MIKKVHIQNFKSINNLEIETGRINLFIGENGSGKSNLLEALVFASASDSNKLDNEFLTSRGIRVTAPELMRSAFEEKLSQNIKIYLSFTGDVSTNYEFVNENTAYSQWYELASKIINALSNTEEEILQWFNRRKNIVNFIIYSPENSSLRNFYKEGQIEPLGINGEGLLKLLNVVNNYEDKSYINTIKESLELFNWFKAIKIPNSLSHSEDKVEIKDKFLYKSFDQRSANEGFLFILFYITLIVAKETPKAFAIDNIDASLNPKLCTKLMTVLTDLAKKYDKQIFLTTHNPAILDGIDLNDEEQKLFTVSRNKNGHTRMKEITVESKPKSSDDEPLKLSEAFLRGYLGGLPKGF